MKHDFIDTNMFNEISNGLTEIGCATAKYFHFYNVTFFLHPSAFNPDRLDLPLVFMSSKIIGWNTGGSPLISVSWKAGFDWGCLVFKKLSVFAPSRRLPFVILFATTSMPHWSFLFPSTSQTLSKRWKFFLDRNLMLTSVEWFQLLIIRIWFHLFPITVVFFWGCPNGLYFFTFCLVPAIITQSL